MPKRTPLYNKHIELKARMTEFAGFEMPLEYTGIIDEHINTRTNVSIFDVSHMGDIIIEGKDTERFLDYLLPTKFSNMVEKQAKYSAYLNENGIMLDDTIVYKINKNKALLIPNASTADMIYNWILSKSNGYDINIIDRTLLYASIAVQGPKSVDVMKKLTNYNYDNMNSFYFDFISIKNLETREDDFFPYNKIMISRTGYTGENGYELIFPNEYAEEIWDMLINEGKEFNLKPAGLGARDTLRMEKGMLLSGQDFHMDKSPIEASISWIIDWDHDFIGKEALLKIKENYKQIFRGFIMIDNGIPRHGYKIFKDGNEVGYITSGTMSPILKKGIGLGYLDKNIKLGDIVDIQIRDKLLKANVSKPKILR
ncbi:MAG: glycine cleavage system aminomethyltransferase GcvT [Thermoplasmata archaeon]|jgi:aminomethyltransferase